jgi:hypothetical protein
MESIKKASRKGGPFYHQGNYVSGWWWRVKNKIKRRTDPNATSPKATKRSVFILSPLQKNINGKKKSSYAAQFSQNGQTTPQDSYTVGLFLCGFLCLFCFSHT